MAKSSEFPRIGAAASLAGLGVALVVGGCAGASADVRDAAGPVAPTDAEPSTTKEPAASDVAQAKRWRRWAHALAGLQSRVERKLLAVQAEPGPFESNPGSDAAMPADNGGLDASAPSALGRLLHERLVLAVARGWLDEAAGCAAPLESDDAARCGARGWGAALQAGESLPAFLDDADRHVTELRERARLARAASGEATIDALRAELQRELAQSIAEAERMQFMKAAEVEEKAADKVSSGKKDKKREIGLEAREAPKPSTPTTGACAPGDPLCGWTDEDDFAGLLPTERGRAAGSPAMPAARAPAPLPGPAGVHAAVVAPAATVLEGVMPLVKAHLTEIGSCLPDPTRSDTPVRLEVKARVAPDGTVRDVQVGPAAELPPTAASCVTAILQQLRVPAPSDGGSHVVSFPLWVAGGAK